jgi:hypothetical protein
MQYNHQTLVFQVEEKVYLDMLGRHRARAFKEEGVKKIPVGLVAYSGGRADIRCWFKK